MKKIKLIPIFAASFWIVTGIAGLTTSCKSSDNTGSEKPSDQTAPPSAKDTAKGIRDTVNYDGSKPHGGALDKSDTIK